MGDGNKVEFLVAICALITSVVAIWVAWDQSRVMRAQQHGMVYPVLQVDGFGNNRDGIIEIGLNVTNSGVGPALIESVSFHMESDEFDSLSDFISTLPEEREVLWSGISGRAMAPGGSVRPLYVFWPANGDGSNFLGQVAQESEKWKLEICYCSVFNRCWKTLDIGRSRAEPVDRCERSETDIFEQLGIEDLTRQRTQALSEETPQ